MPIRPPFPPGLSVPSHRLSRLARFGGLATGVAGEVLRGGARQLAEGRRPRLGDLLLTPANARRVTEQLAQLRGAAMKMGQLLSMDAGDLLPPELADILARLRADAHPMPEGQLRAVLDAEWGEGWQSRFIDFRFRPVAAASIGQVHRAVLLDGRELAVKVQYPGIARSIDSDVDNVATLLRLARLLPGDLDLAPLLREAKRQLHEEADYEREGRCLAQFGARLADDPRFRVPDLHSELSTGCVLAMSFERGEAIETVEDAPQALRDETAARLIDLALRELFEFNLMQTDPNPGNYRWDRSDERIVLLDFGATRRFAPATVEAARDVAAAALRGSGEDATDAIGRLAAADGRLSAANLDAALRIFALVSAPLRAGGVYDFGDKRLANDLRNLGLELAETRVLPQAPPPDTLFLQRKFGGLFLLVSRWNAKVDVRSLLERHLDRQ